MAVFGGRRTRRRYSGHTTLLILILPTLSPTVHAIKGTFGRRTAARWRVPLVAAGACLLMIPLLRARAARAPCGVKRVALWWNAGLSAFSCVGLAVLRPCCRRARAQRAALTTCAPRWYGQGWHGLWVALFVCRSSQAVDTALLLAGRPVVAAGARRLLYYHDYYYY